MRKLLAIGIRAGTAADLGLAPQTVYCALKKTLVPMFLCTLLEKVVDVAEDVRCDLSMLGFGLGVLAWDVGCDGVDVGAVEFR